MLTPIPVPYRYHPDINGIYGTSKYFNISTQGQCCGAATFRVEPEPIFLKAGADFFKAAPATSFWQAKKESLVVLTKHDLRANYNGKCDPKKTCIINSLFKSSK